MPRKISEERTRKEMMVLPFSGGIDPQLEHAGWYLADHSKVRINGWHYEHFISQHNYSANMIRFLRSVQSVFLQKRHLETANLYDAPAIVGFGQDAVEKWFTEKKVEEVVEFANKLSV